LWFSKIAWNIPLVSYFVKEIVALLLLNYV